MVPEVPSVVTRTATPAMEAIPLRASIVASFRRWRHRTRPFGSWKPTSHRGSGSAWRVARTSSRRKGRGPSTRNAMYRYLGRRVPTLTGEEREKEKGWGGKSGGGQRTSSTSDVD